VGLQAVSFGTVPTLKAPVALPLGNADTIVNSLGKFPNAGARDLVRGAAETGFFSYNEPSCSGAGIGGPDVGQQLAVVGLGSVPVVGKLLSGIAGAFLGNHAAAVRNEQATLCRAVPAANNFLRGIDTAFALGQLDTATASQALDQGLQNWLGQVKPILKDTGGKCNAACVYEKAFRAAIEKRKQDYALIDAQNSSGAQGLLGGVVNAVSDAASTVVRAVTGSAPAFGQVGAAYSQDSYGAPAGVVSSGSLPGVVVIGGLLLAVVVVAKILGR
jgi:hypothetical protein